MKSLFNPFLLVLVLGFAGCKEETQTYSIPKEQAVSSTSLPPSTPSAPGLKWKAPGDWTVQPAGGMRQASFLVSQKDSKADISVISLPGAAGNDLSNVNRWRGQVELPPVTEKELSASAQSVTSPAGPIRFWNFCSTKNLPDQKNRTRILAAIMKEGDKTWFFKMMGDDSLVQKQKNSFVQFLKSLETSSVTSPPSAGSPPPPSSTPAPEINPHATLPPSHPPIPRNNGNMSPSLPPSHPPLTGNATEPPHSHSQKVSKAHWTTPNGWKETPPTGMRHASYTIPGNTPASNADVAIITLKGTGGGPLAAVNMWRSQLNLQPLKEGELEKSTKKLKAGKNPILLVDLIGPATSSTGAPNRMIGAILVLPTETWYVKLTGDPLLVNREKPVFEKFVQSFRFDP